MDPAEVLRDRERLLAIEYGASHPPHSLSGEDLECDDPRDARHWIRVYTELVEFAHGLAQDGSSERDDDAPEVGYLHRDARAMTLQVRVLELHLAYWTDRLRRLGPVCDLPGAELAREGPP